MIPEAASVLPSLSLASLCFAAVRNNGEGLLPRGGAFYQWGRDALAAVLDAARVVPGDRVMLPVSCCRVVLEIFWRRGVEIAYYALDERLQYSPDEIEDLLDRPTKAIYITHFFGMPQDPAPLRELTSARGVLLLEDAAHTCAGTAMGHRLGEIGDFSIFSLRKVLPVADGGYAWSKAGLPLRQASGRSTNLRASARVLKLIMRNLTERSSAMTELVSRLPRPVGTEKGPDPLGLGSNGVISRLSQAILERTPVERVSSKRREHFKFWADAVDSGRIRATPVYPELVPGAIPYSYPVRVADAASVHALLRSRGMDFEQTVNPPYYGEFGLERQRSTRFSAVEQLAQTVISLPIHQELTHEGLLRLATEFHRANRAI